MLVGRNHVRFLLLPALLPLSAGDDPGANLVRRIAEYDCLAPRNVDRVITRVNAEYIGSARTIGNSLLATVAEQASHTATHCHSVKLQLRDKLDQRRYFV